MIFSISAKSVFITSIVRQIDRPSVHVIIAEDKKQAYFLNSDFENFFNENSVYFLPEPRENESDKRDISSIKTATAKVRRTAVIAALNDYPKIQRTELAEGSFSINSSLLSKNTNGKYNPLIIISYPDALTVPVLSLKKTKNSILKMKVGEKLTHQFVSDLLFENGFTKVDFVSEPGEFSLRGSIIDIFSFSDNQPYRIDFFGEDIESIRKFDANTQLSIQTLDQVEIYPDIISNTGQDSEKVSFLEILPENTIVWNVCDRITGLAQNTLLSHLEADCTSRKLNYQDINDFLSDVVPQPVFSKNFDLLTEDLKNKKEDGYRITVLSPNDAQTLRLQQILRDIGGGVRPEFLPISLHEGYIDNNAKECYYTDHQIFERYHKIKVSRQVERSERLTINDLASFQIGDYVVHIDHGVGKYGGLVKTNLNGKVQEAIKLIYKDNDVVFVSIHGIHRISKFKSRDGEPPRIYKLGTKAWENIKNTTKAKVKDIAKDLIKLYSERQAVKGFAFSADSYLQNELESSFLYEDTPDQDKANIAIKADMESVHPMDRLVCGDVGFGKTELAIRAAFKAACDGKQVAVLVPTTILALQHFKTFSARLANFPCKVEYLSRLKTTKEIKQITEDLKGGKIDIIIGTHRLLNKSIEFKDLGLLIIDEEQKFGVTAKERLRQLKLSVDTLTLTATPIPRTLQFSLLGARDLSIINTPPPNRLPVYTEVINFDDEVVADIINQELERGGQVFFVHNKVEDIMSVKDILQRIVPEADICVAHGQMEPQELERKVLEFINGDHDILLATTIVENGIDIPNANTIIINQAQRFGLSDLHQLRGRVGRSNVKAYCYLIIPPITSLSDDARRRIKAIEAFSELGSGFNIAMQDLDIRGAGNLLGAEQSGFISEMGFETYMKILNEAMTEIELENPAKPENGTSSEGTSSEDVKNNPKEPIGLKLDGLTQLNDVFIDTDMELLIPDSYVNVPAEKIRLYKELDSITTQERLDKFSAELEDRFGPIPHQLQELMHIVELRRLASEMGIERIILKNNIMLSYFISNQMHPFYKSDKFVKVLTSIQEKSSAKWTNYQLIEQNKKLYIKSTQVNSIEKALKLLQDILPL